MAANVSYQWSSPPDIVARNYSNKSLPSAGSAISNLKGMHLSGRASAGLGTLGFLAAKRDAPDWRTLVLVSNRHVLLAHDAERGDLVFQPGYSEQGAQVNFSASDLNAIARIDHEGLCGHFSYAYPGESRKSYYIDCATATLLLKQASNPMRITGRTQLFTQVTRVHPLDTANGRELKVRLLGHADPRWGKIIDSEATVETVTGELCRNTLVIRALPDKHGVLRPFSRKGDSGALLVDQYQRAVGLLWGNHTRDPYISYACHICPVLSYLNIIPWRYDFCAPRSIDKG
ncbi:MAG: hypothetical protein H6939_07115 [Burkholderiales bacterium]|nr:hypothetical protein [Burkholderiales bacterium]MCP5292350.1 hypothetical protein [Burkholderiales bacterium]